MLAGFAAVSFCFGVSFLADPFVPWSCAVGADCDVFCCAPLPESAAEPVAGAAAADPAVLGGAAAGEEEWADCAAATPAVHNSKEAASAVCETPIRRREALFVFIVGNPSLQVPLGGKRVG